jgi:hypothetical protein
MRLIGRADVVFSRERSHAEAGPGRDILRASREPIDDEDPEDYAS